VAQCKHIKHEFNRLLVLNTLLPTDAHNVKKRRVIKTY